MVNDFYKDLNAAKGAELLAAQCLAQLTDAYSFQNVGDLREYFHKGDIIATEKATGKQVFIEVKDDACIAATHNVLCEEEVYFKESASYRKGNMYSDYQIYCVVSQQARQMYLIDFSVLREHYKKGIYKVIPHQQQTTYCYLCSLKQIADWGAGIAVINY